MSRHERPVHGRCLFLALAAAMLSVNAARADEPEPIKPEEARQHVGEKVTVTFEVKSSKNARHRKTIFLDSELNFRDNKNLGIAISEQGARDIKAKRNIDAPADYYLNKTIRVVGTIVIREERPYVDVDQASQIEEVDDTNSR